MTCCFCSGRVLRLCCSQAPGQRLCGVRVTKALNTSVGHKETYFTPANWVFLTWSLIHFLLLGTIIYQSTSRPSSSTESPGGSRSSLSSTQSSSLWAHIVSPLLLDVCSNHGSRISNSFEDFFNLYTFAAPTTGGRSPLSGFAPSSRSLSNSLRTPPQNIDSLFNFYGADKFSK